MRVLWESDVDEASLNSIHLLLERTVSQVPLATEKYRLALHPRRKD